MVLQPVEAVPTSSCTMTVTRRHNRRRRLHGSRFSARPPWTTISVRSRCEQLDQTVARRVASASEGRWNSLMVLTVGSQTPSTCRNASRSLGWRETRHPRRLARKTRRRTSLKRRSVCQKWSRRTSRSVAGKMLHQSLDEPTIQFRAGNGDVGHCQASVWSNGNDAGWSVTALTGRALSWSARKTPSRSWQCWWMRTTLLMRRRARASPTTYTCGIA